MNNISRRRILKSATGATLALPFLESLHLSAEVKKTRDCLLAIQMPLGIYAGALFPDGSNLDPLSTEYLAPFKDFHPKMTLLSGMYHPGVSNGHVSGSRVFTGKSNLGYGDPKLAPNAESFDQVAARHLGKHTRFSSISLNTRGEHSASWFNNGMNVPAQTDMKKLFDRLFKEESVADQASHQKRLNMKKSVLDAIWEHSKTIEGSLTQTDRDKLGEYFHAIRETEYGIRKEGEWLDRPRPKVDADAYPDQRDDGGFMLKVRNQLDMAYLALVTDSTRIMTSIIGAQGNVGIEGVNNGYHGLSHRGKDPENIRQLKIIESSILAEIKRLLNRLDAVVEPDGKTLLDHTTVILTSNLGNGSNHSSQNLPVVVFGGGYNHQKYISYTPANETPLCNLYLTTLQKMGVPEERFSTSTGIINQLV